MPTEHRCKYCRGKIVTLHIGNHIYVYCEQCGDKSSPYNIPKSAVQEVFKKEAPKPIIIDIKPVPEWKKMGEDIYIKGKQLFKKWGKALHKKYNKTREIKMAKVEVVKNRSWFLINVLGQKICKDNPELFEHFKDNKPVKLTIETVEIEAPEPVVEVPVKTVEDYTSEEKTE